MLGFIKSTLKLFLLPILYFGGIYTIFFSIFRNVEYGFFLLVALIPQPNLWYKLRDYPMGKDFLDLLYIGIIIGMIYQRKGFEKTINATLIGMFILLSYFALLNSSTRFALPIPLTGANPLFADWKNYVQMIAFYFLSFNIFKKEDSQKKVFLLITLTILFVALRSYRNFSAGDTFDYNKRAGGPFEIVGLGANHFGAFIAYYCAAILGMSFFEVNKKIKYLFLATVLLGLHPLFFSYSRGVYLAFFTIIVYFGLVKKRSLLLIALVVVLLWQTLLPPSVVDRIMMTKTEEGQLEGSAAHRLDLWDHAINLFNESPVIGIGFGGFGYTVAEGELTDTHNFYVKTLCEQGIVGISFLLIIFTRAFISGFKLFRNGNSQFQKGLGLGFTGAVVACMIANIFGDRWSYFALGSYFWIIWGMVDRNLFQVVQDRGDSRQVASSPA